MHVTCIYVDKISDSIKWEVIYSVNVDNDD